MLFATNEDTAIYSLIMQYCTTTSVLNVWSIRNNSVEFVQPTITSTNSKYFKLFWIILIHKSKRNSHHSIIIARNFFGFAYFYCIVIVIMRIVF